MSGNPYFDDDPFDAYSSIEQRGPKGFDVALICLNGHMINDSSKAYPQKNSPHCADCGAKTISKCPDCKADIRGKYHNPDILDLSGDTIPTPRFCAHCGNEYPWTASHLSAARELIREAESLSENEKGLLDRSLDDLVRDTPNTVVAVARFKRLAAKAGSTLVEGLKSILIDVVAESAKRQIWH